MNYKITHKTQYSYSTSASHTINIAKMTPPSNHRQNCHTHHLEVLPLPNTISTRVDYFGNQLSYFSVNQRHTVLEVVAISDVTVFAQQLISQSLSCAQVRQQLNNPARYGHTFSE